MSVSEVPTNGPAPGEPVPVVTVHPEQFKIEVELDREVFLDLKLTNTSNQLVTFKVKTTARDRYLLRPTQDYIQPKGEKICKIVMTKMKEYPDLSNPKNLKDKFLVQSTVIEKEVPDLTKYWKELESHHNPKAHHYVYAETKIKCKLQVPAKLRAQDAAKRGQAEEEAASSSSSASASSSAAAASGGVTSSTLPVPPVKEERRKSSSALDDPLGSSMHSVVPHAVPVPPSSSTTDTSSATNATTAALTQQLLDAEKAKYAELMEFVVKTTQKLESERVEKESAEAKAQSAADRAKQAEVRAAQAEAALAQVKQQLAQVQSTAQKRGESQGDSSLDEEGSAEGGVRRRGGATKPSDGERSTPASPSSSTTATSSASSPSPVPTTLIEKPSTVPGLSLQFWQIALLGLVCFVLGRIFG